MLSDLLWREHSGKSSSQILSDSDLLTSLPHALTFAVTTSRLMGSAFATCSR
jgi:hypothetical protein